MGTKSSLTFLNVRSRVVHGLYQCHLKGDNSKGPPHPNAMGQADGSEETVQVILEHDPTAQPYGNLVINILPCII